MGDMICERGRVIGSEREEL